MLLAIADKASASAVSAPLTRIADGTTPSPNHFVPSEHAFLASVIRSANTWTAMSSHAHPHPRQMAWWTARGWVRRSPAEAMEDRDVIARLRCPACECGNSLEENALDLMSRYLHINRMRRKAGALVPLELAICTAAVELRGHGTEEFHGYLLAKEIKEHADNRLLTAYGTLYRALGRLESMGLLTSRWEDAMIAADENRPRRRLYALTPAGEEAAADAAKAAAAKSARKGWASA